MRIAVALLALLVVLAPTPLVRAQEDATPAPWETPPPNPRAYDDAAMHFQAPADYKYLGQRHLKPQEVGDPAVVAAWVEKPGDPNERDLLISVEQYSGDASGFEQQAENDIRNNIDDAFVDHKEQVTTNNGMPAYFLQVSYGSGFDAKKQFELVWADGLRGVTIALIGPTGELNEKEAKAVLLADVTAVAYPGGRE